MDSLPMMAGDVPVPSGEPKIDNMLQAENLPFGTKGWVEPNFSGNVYPNPDPAEIMNQMGSAPMGGAGAPSDNDTDDNLIRY